MQGSFVTYHIFLGPRPMRQLVTPRSRAVGGMQPRMKLSTLATESRGPVSTVGHNTTWMHPQMLVSRRVSQY
jgi:hypothetical protein